MGMLAMHTPEVARLNLNGGFQLAAIQLAKENFFHRHTPDLGLCLCKSLQSANCCRS